MFLATWLRCPLRPNPQASTLFPTCSPRIRSKPDSVAGLTAPCPTPNTAGAPGVTVPACEAVSPPPKSLPWLPATLETKPPIPLASTSFDHLDRSPFLDSLLPRLAVCPRHRVIPDFLRGPAQTSPPPGQLSAPTGRQPITRTLAPCPHARPAPPRPYVTAVPSTESAPGIGTKARTWEQTAPDWGSPRSISQGVSADSGLRGPG